MDSHIQIHRVPYEDADAWHDFRYNRGIGGSEASVIMGINPYTSVARLFNQRIGNAPRMDYTNEKMFFGTQLEELIAETWKYYDGLTPDSYVTNHAAGKIIRSCRRINGFAVNSKYPWLFGSVDRLINIKDGFELLDDRKPLTKNGILECKNISSMAANIWLDGVPMYFIVQCTVYMIIYEVDYCEICMLQNGNELKVIPLRRDELLVEQILESTHDFWYNRVLVGRQALQIKREAIMKGDAGQAEEAQGLLDRLEPPPDSTEDYEMFMKEKYRVERERIAGTPVWYEWAKADKLCNQYINALNDKRQLLQNQLKNVLVTEKCEVIDFKTLGRISWSKNTNGTLVLRNGIKEKPTEQFVDTQVKQLKMIY